MRITNLRITVLGAGFIGSHLIETLAKYNYPVKVLTKSMPLFLNKIGSDQIQYILGDFSNEQDLARALDGCDICFHLISTVLPKSSNLNPIFDIETNLISTVKLLKYAVNAGVKKIIFLSSGGTVYGHTNNLPIDENHPTNPICSYGITKLAIEKYLHLYYRMYGLNYIILRLSNPFGERQLTHAPQGVIAVFLGRILQRKAVDIFGSGSTVRDYIYISDVISAMLSAIDYDGGEHTFNIGSGVGLSLIEVLAAIELVSGIKAERRYINSRAFDVTSSILSCQKAKEALKWTPQISFRDGLLRTLNHHILAEKNARDLCVLT